MTPHTRAAFQHSNLLVPSPPSLSELQRGLLDAHQWNGLDNDLLIGKDAGCPVHISMTPAGRGAAAAAAFITQSIANVITCGWSAYEGSFDVIICFYKIVSCSVMVVWLDLPHPPPNF